MTRGPALAWGPGSSRGDKWDECYKLCQETSNPALCEEVNCSRYITGRSSGSRPSGAAVAAVARGTSAGLTLRGMGRARGVGKSYAKRLFGDGLSVDVQQMGEGRYRATVNAQGGSYAHRVFGNHFQADVAKTDNGYRASVNTHSPQGMRGMGVGFVLPAHIQKRKRPRAFQCPAGTHKKPGIYAGPPKCVPNKGAGMKIPVSGVHAASMARGVGAAIPALPIPPQPRRPGGSTPEPRRPGGPPPPSRRYGGGTPAGGWAAGGGTIGVGACGSTGGRSAPFRNPTGVQYGVGAAVGAQPGMSYGVQDNSQQVGIFGPIAGRWPGMGVVGR
jgi:hypothetical protein